MAGHPPSGLAFGADSTLAGRPRSASPDAVVLAASRGPCAGWVPRDSVKAYDQGCRGTSPCPARVRRPAVSLTECIKGTTVTDPNLPEQPAGDRRRPARSAGDVPAALRQCTGRARTAGSAGECTGRARRSRVQRARGARLRRDRSGLRPAGADRRRQDQYARHHLARRVARRHLHRHRIHRRHRLRPHLAQPDQEDRRAGSRHRDRRPDHRLHRHRDLDHPSRSSSSRCSRRSPPTRTSSSTERGSPATRNTTTERGTRP